ncbi:MAG: ABC transporter permease [Rhodospirillaceae bacterium]|nr:ABC transporter permease [Rhodospirillaceae bacterium]
MTPEAGWIEGKHERDLLVFRAGGAWNLQALARLVRVVRGAVPGRSALGGRTRARIDLAGVTLLDSSGAWLVADTKRRLDAMGVETEIVGEMPADRALLERVERALRQVGTLTPPSKTHPLLGALANIGRIVFEAAGKGHELLSFFGLTVILIVRAMARPWSIHFKATIKHIETTGLNALPIVGLLNFLIGMVVAFMGAVQLKKFGAEIFTVNLVGVAVLRELGVLITAILIAGRSGSAFTAQIGTMKVNQEIDAMQTIGLNPVEVLVLPRVLAMMISLPLLTFYADVMGLAGGALMATVSLDISLDAFLRQLHDSIEMSTFLIGFLKAPFCAYIIALVGCFEGMQVGGSAESVGTRTTMAVVEAIFLVIVFDALVAIGLSILDI